MLKDSLSEEFVSVIWSVMNGKCIYVFELMEDIYSEVNFFIDREKEVFEFVVDGKNIKEIV